MQYHYRQIFTNVRMREEAGTILTSFRQRAQSKLWSIQNLMWAYFPKHHTTASNQISRLFDYYPTHEFSFNKLLSEYFHRLPSFFLQC